MRRPEPAVAAILHAMESVYGNQEPYWPTDPYDFLVWWHCGYPQSDTNCAKGWDSLRRTVGTEPWRILEAGTAKLTRALEPGGMVPELRALRLLQIAARVQDELGGDLHSALAGPMPGIRKTLKKFPNIADPGVDRILLFGDISPVPAVPSNCPHVLVRILLGRERENYGVTYREAKDAIEAQIPPNFGARKRAYLLLKKHGQTLCKSSKPKCDQCPVQSACAFFAGNDRGRFRET